MTESTGCSGSFQLHFIFISFSFHFIFISFHIHLHFIFISSSFHLHFISYSFHFIFISFHFHFFSFSFHFIFIFISFHIHFISSSFHFIFIFNLHFFLICACDLLFAMSIMSSCHERELFASCAAAAIATTNMISIYYYTYISIDH